MNDYHPEAMAAIVFRTPVASVPTMIPMASPGCGDRRMSVRPGLAFALLLLPVSPLMSRTDGQDQVVFGDSVREVPSAGAGAAADPHRAAVVRSVLSPGEMAGTIDFEVALRLRDMGGLKARAELHEHISRDEMASRYHPGDGGYDAVRSWLLAQGFAVEPSDGTRVAIFARGTISQVARAFKATFARVAYHGGEYTSAVTAPTLPAALAPAVLAVDGLQPHLRMHHHSLTSTDPPYTPAQILAAYNGSGLSVNGAGQTIGIVIDSYPSSADLTSFWTQCGISQSLGNITHVPVVNGAPSGEPADLEEATLDVEWSSAIAPAAKINIYETSDLSFAHIDRAYEAIYHALPDQPGLCQVSLSYGAGEATEISTDQLRTDQQYFLLLASSGVTIFAASGDGGSASRSSRARTKLSTALRTRSPSLTCGGVTRTGGS